MVDPVVQRERLVAQSLLAAKGDPEAMRVYKEVGYDGMMMPDHVPRIEGVDSQQGFAFAFGYIKALIAAVSAEA